MKWIKLSLDVFNDEKLIMIENMANADTIIAIWFKLLVLAGRQNHDGLIYLNDKIPYTDEMLASIFRRKVADVRQALDAFEQLEMIKIVDGIIGIPHWNEYVTADRKEYMRDYMRNYREKLPEKKPEQIENLEGQMNISQFIEVSESPKTEEKPEKQKSVQKYQWFVDLWNTLEPLGIKPIKGIHSGSQRHTWLTARLKTYTEEDFKQAIENVKHSDFLQGKSKKSFNFTCDWFLRPNNFPKVLEGNYNNTTTKTNDDDWDSFFNE